MHGHESPYGHKASGQCGEANTRDCSRRDADEEEGGCQCNCAAKSFRSVRRGHEHMSHLHAHRNGPSRMQPDRHGDEDVARILQAVA
eukprot:6194839-Pleurochrysis_carterae.AAC.2